MCGNIICIIAVTLLPLLLIYITCLSHFRLSGYTWDIFLAYIRHRLSSRTAPVYFGKAVHDIKPFKLISNVKPNECSFY